MSDRVGVISVRGRMVIGAGILVLVAHAILNTAELSHYYFEMGPNLDRSVGDRVCLVLDWMLFACLVVWAASAFRVHQSVLFEGNGGLVLPWAAGVTGVIVVFTALVRLIAKPIAGQEFGAFEGWQFGVGWLLVWWCLVFRK